MPAYVLAYVYTDFLQFVGPPQTWLREAFDWRRGDYWFPDVRSTGGAIAMFVFVLYPYVYLLARTTFIERASGHVGGGAHAWPRPVAQLFARLLAAGTSGGGCWCVAGINGDAGRLRHRVLFRRADVHHSGDLSCLVFRSATGLRRRNSPRRCSPS